MKYLTLLLLFLLCCSCVDEIDLRQGDQLGSGVFISGRLSVTDEQLHVRVFAGRLFNFNSNRSERFINDQLSVVSSRGEVYVIPYWRERDVFELRTSVAFGTLDTVSYQLRLDTDREEVFASDWVKLPPALLADSIEVSRETSPGVEEEVLAYSLQVNTLAEDDNQYGFLYRLQEDYALTDFGSPRQTCYFNNVIDQFNFSIIPPASNTGSAVRRVSLLRNKLDFRYHEGHYLTVIYETLTPQAYDYLEKYRSIISTTESIYEPPPGNLPSNIRQLSGVPTENTYGNFYATRSTTIRRGMPPRTVPVGGEYCNSQPRLTTQRCLRCIRATGAMFSPPPFWEY